MKIAIPTMGNQGLEESVAQHFGRCPTYTFLDEEGHLLEIIPNTSSHMGGTDLPPKLLSDHGVSILLCQGIGPKAMQLCKDYKIDTFVDESRTVKEFYEKWKNNRLSKATLENACEEHRL